MFEPRGGRGGFSEPEWGRLLGFRRWRRSITAAAPSFGSARAKTRGQERKPFCGLPLRFTRCGVGCRCVQVSAAWAVGRGPWRPDSLSVSRFYRQWRCFPFLKKKARQEIFHKICKKNLLGRAAKQNTNKDRKGRKKNSTQESHTALDQQVPPRRVQQNTNKAHRPRHPWWQEKKNKINNQWPHAGHSGGAPQ
jgi:hypothetical protein